MNGSDPKGYYEVLGVAPNASAGEIKTAYRRKAMEYHPDRCHLPNAKELFQRVEEAYRVLHEPTSRSRYDASEVATPDPTTSEPEAPEPIHCSVCGVVSAQPRYVIFYRAVSFLFASRSDPVQGIYCRKCAEKQSLKATLFTWALGWWGIPFGPIFALHALLINMFGGKRPADVNARILAHQAWYFAASGRMDIAQAIAKQALRLALKHSRRPTDEDARLRASLDAFIAALPPQTSKLRLANVWLRFRRPFFIQAGLMCAGVIALGIFLAQPSSPQNTAADITEPAPMDGTAATPPSMPPAPPTRITLPPDITTPAAPLVAASVTPAGLPDMSPPIEERPPVGTDNVLTAEQITYCSAQKMRLTAAQRAMNQYAASDIDRINAMVDDYNSRCGSYRYDQGVRAAAVASVAPFRRRYEREGKAWFATSSAQASAAMLTPVPIQQGVQHVYVDAERIAPFRMTTSEGPDNYFIKLVDTVTGLPVMTMYVKGGTTYETNVPVGTYQIHYATGQTWYGIRHLFGPATAYSETVGNFTFSIQGNEAQGNEVELVPQIGGNLATKTISAAQF